MKVSGASSRPRARAIRLRPQQAQARAAEPDLLYCLARGWVAVLGIGGLTSHSSRCRFAARLNSGVRRSMKQSRCPHCSNDPGLGLWEKTGLGPGRSRPCIACGSEVSVSLIWIIGFILLTSWLPLLMAFFGLVLSSSYSSGRVVSGLATFGGLAVGVLVLAAVYKRVVPLTTRSA